MNNLPIYAFVHELSYLPRRTVLKHREGGIIYLKFMTKVELVHELSVFAKANGSGPTDDCVRALYSVSNDTLCIEMRRRKPWE